MIDKSVLLKQFIPSKTVRQYMSENQITISDRDWATIIWNSDLYLSAKHGYLMDIAWNTKEQDLKKQIEERVAYDKKALDHFYNYHEGCVYALNSLEFKDEENIIGYFKIAKVAAEYGVDSGHDFQVRKHQLIDEGTELIKGRCMLSPAVQPDPEKQVEEFDFPVMPLAEITFNKYGTIMSYWSGELPGEEALKVESLSRNRFENGFARIPNPFEKGNFVRKVGEDRIGVVKTSQEEWKKTLQRALQPEAADDWMDIWIKVQYDEDPEKNNCINPIFLEWTET